MKPDERVAELVDAITAHGGEAGSIEGGRTGHEGPEPSPERASSTIGKPSDLDSHSSSCEVVQANIDGLARLEAGDLATRAGDIVLAASNQLRALCHGARWAMSIPVQDDDSDVALGCVIRLATHQLAEITQLRSERDAAVIAREHLDAVLDSETTLVSKAGIPVTMTWRQIISVARNAERSAAA